MTAKKYNVKIHFLDDCRLSEVRAVLDMLPKCMQDENRYAMLWDVRNKPKLNFFITALKFNQLNKVLPKMEEMNLHIEIEDHAKLQ